MQDKEINNPLDFTDIFRLPETGRLVGVDPGTKRFGLAVTDELQVTARPLATIERTGWKKLLVKIKEMLAELDAVGLVIGLPYNFDGSESEMSHEARRLARNFALSLAVPVALQDERATTYEARGRLWHEGASDKRIRATLDSEAAAVILRDFLARREEMKARGKAGKE